MVEGELEHGLKELFIEMTFELKTRNILKKLETKGILLFDVVEVHDGVGDEKNLPHKVV